MNKEGDKRTRSREDGEEEERRGGEGRGGEKTGGEESSGMQKHTSKTFLH